MKSKIDRSLLPSNETVDQQKQLATGEKFLELMVKLKPDELCALAKILGVRLLTDEVDPETKHAIARDAYDIIDDCIDHYAMLSRSDRRFILKELKRTVRAR